MPIPLDFTTRERVASRTCELTPRERHNAEQSHRAHHLDRGVDCRAASTHISKKSTSKATAERAKECACEERERVSAGRGFKTFLTAQALISRKGWGRGDRWGISREYNGIAHPKTVCCANTETWRKWCSIHSFLQFS